MIIINLSCQGPPAPISIRELSTPQFTSQNTARALFIIVSGNFIEENKVLEHSSNALHSVSYNCTPWRAL